MKTAFNDCPKAASERVIKLFCVVYSKRWSSQMRGSAGITKVKTQCCGFHGSWIINSGLSRPRYELRQTSRLLQSSFRPSPFDIMAPRAWKIGLRRCVTAHEQLRSEPNVPIITKSVIIFDLLRPRCEWRQPPRLLQSGFRANPYDIMAPCTWKNVLRTCAAAQK